MADNRNPHKLDPIENERIFREKILPNLLDKNPTLRPSDTPTMLVVGGQPGAGKSNSIKGIEADFAGRDGVLVVDLDALRERHPKYTQLMRADDKAAAQYSYDDARIWSQKSRRLRQGQPLQRAGREPDDLTRWRGRMAERLSRRWLPHRSACGGGERAIQPARHCGTL